MRHLPALLAACWCALLLACCCCCCAQHVVPGRVTPSRYPQTWDMARSTAMMACNSTGPMDPGFSRPWGLVDLDWNGGKTIWSATKPMTAEEFMLANLQAIEAVNPEVIGWVYRNGVKALPWHTTVRRLLEDRAQWGLFMPVAGCMPQPGHYTCGPNATQNLYHDFEQTPRGDCGAGVECGEYVFNHRNDSLRSFLLGDYFFGPTGGGSKSVKGFYVDDEWTTDGPSEMDKDAVQKMGMSPADVQAMIAAYEGNRQAWRDALVAAGLFEWFLFYGGQQTAPGQNQTCGACSCQAYLERNCGPNSPTQNGTLFYGFSRTAHSQPWPLPTPLQDQVMFMLSRGPYAYFGYGWSGCASRASPFTRPASLDVDYGTPLGFCQLRNGSRTVWERHYTKATVTMDCSTFTASITPVPAL